MSSERDAQNRKLAEWLEPSRSLDGFCICAASGQRLRDRDFDTREEAQRYIDAEDEQLNEIHKSTAHGVNIQPCVKAHPDFFTSEDASAMLRTELARRAKVLRIIIAANGHTTVIVGSEAAPDATAVHSLYLTAIALAALALIEAEEKHVRQ